MTEEGPEPEEGGLKSWWLPKYPPHKCPTCDWEHRKIPLIRETRRMYDADVPFEYLPFELLGVAGSSTSPGKGHQCEVNDGTIKPDTRVQVAVLFWGIPGSPQILDQRIIMMN